MGTNYGFTLFYLLKSRYDQGILDVGMTKEDKVELVKTHSFTRKHATGKAKIELHVLQVQRPLLVSPGKCLIMGSFDQVERGMSWEAAEQKKEEAAQDENEGYWLSMQVS